MTVSFNDWLVVYLILVSFRAHDSSTEIGADFEI